ncbi:MAG: entericidin A/B family lipoprotein [Alphaproteobacteria bacterium]|nr:entericidin A/B family lipoprotein [Alphaproteobacteria bacterium]
MKPLLVLLTLLCLTACNTMEGIGKDIESGGNNLRKSAQRNK